MFEPWTEKYRPRSMKEVVGQPGAVSQMLDWAKKWARGRVKPPALLLYGPHGTGKTSAALALASEMGWEVLELNASDERTYEAIKRFGAGATMGSLMGRRKLLLLDEADNLERGGHRAVVELLERTANPVILTATSNRDVPEGIRKYCLEIQFRRIAVSTIVNVLRKVCDAEKIKVEEGVLETIAEGSKGDLRAAINDLQVTCSGVEYVSKREVFTSPRLAELNIFQVLGVLLKARTCSEARNLLFSLDMPPEDALSWISENVPRMLKEPEDLEHVYNFLSEADLFRARLSRRQAYRLEKYMCDLMTAGVAVSRRGEVSFVRFQFPTAGVMFARGRGARALRESISEKLARHCHTSAHHSRRDLLPYLLLILKKAPSIAEVLQLTEEERDFIGA